MKLLDLRSFFVQVNPHKDVPLKVTTSEIESVGTMKRLNKKRIQMKKMKKLIQNEKKKQKKTLNKRRFQTK